MEKNIRVAIDGPAGSGKSTVTRLLAQKLGFLYLDTGALYRAATLGCLLKGIDLSDTASVVEAVGEMDVELREGVPFLDGSDVSAEIRKPGLTSQVKYVAAVPDVRKLMTEAARRAAAGRDIVAEGRDAATVIFPEAELKIYLDATDGERARRRHEELLEKGESVTYEEVLEAIRLRDRSDYTRSDDPLKIAPGAEVIDTTSLAVGQVVDKIEKLVKRQVDQDN